MKNAWSYDRIPLAMKERNNWVMWSKELRNGRECKVPYQISHRKARADVSKPSTWAEFGIVADVCTNYPDFYDGIGYVLDGGGIVCIDLDSCLYLSSGRAKSKAAKIVEDMASYTEISQSGRGLHIFGFADADTIERIGNGRRKDGLEVYANRRYIATTGNVYGNYSELRDISRPLATLIESEFRAEVSHQRQGSAGTVESTEVCNDLPEPLTESDRGLIDQARQHWRTGSQFSALFDLGDLSMDRNDHSRADWHLLNILAFWAKGDAKTMLRIFSASKLAERPKWRTRADYRANIVQSVLKKRSGNA